MTVSAYSSSSSTSLDTLSEQLRAVSLSQPLSPTSSDYKALLRSFAGSEAAAATTTSRSALSTSYAYLARLLLQPTHTSSQSTKGKQVDRNDHLQAIAHLLGNDYLNSTDLNDLSIAFAALVAILQVDVTALSSVLQLHGIESKLLDAAELVTDGTPKVVELDDASGTHTTETPYHRCSRCFVNLVATLAGYGSTRPLARRMVTISSGSNAWFVARANLSHTTTLERQTGQAFDDPEVTAAASVTFIKLQIPDSPASASLGNVPTATASSTTVDAPSDAKLYGTLTQILPTASANANANTTSTAAAQNLALEGLALLSLKPSIRRVLTKDEALLAQLFTKFTPSAGTSVEAGEQSHPHNDTLFSLATLLVHLTAYHRMVGEEEKAKEKLRRYANLQNANDPSKADDGQTELDENDEEIDRRMAILLERGIMQAVLSFVKSSSSVVRQLAASILLNLTDKRERRGSVTQQGGARMLMVIIKQKDQISKALASLNVGSVASASSSGSLTSSHGAQSLPSETFIPIQALAKLLITANPLLVLGPTKDSPILIDSIHPLALPILFPDVSSLLQKFESLMALTNIASLDESLQERISRCAASSDRSNGSTDESAAATSFLARVEELILDCGSASSPSDDEEASTTTTTDGRVLCRRAATELLCNLVSCETAFVRFSGITNFEELETVAQEGGATPKLPPARVTTRLHVFVALSDVQDLQTRMAALAILATLTMAPAVCAFLAASSASPAEKEGGLGGGDRKFSILVSAAQDRKEPGIQLRAIECLKNIALHVRARRKEVSRALEFVARLSSDQDVKDSAREALEALSHL